MNIRTKGFALKMKIGLMPNYFTPVIFTELRKPAYLRLGPIKRENPWARTRYTFE